MKKTLNVVLTAPGTKQVSYPRWLLKAFPLAAVLATDYQDFWDTDRADNPFFLATGSFSRYTLETQADVTLFAPTYTIMDVLKYWSVPPQVIGTTRAVVMEPTDWKILEKFAYDNGIEEWILAYPLDPLKLVDETDKIGLATKVYVRYAIDTEGQVVDTANDDYDIRELHL